MSNTYSVMIDDALIVDCQRASAARSRVMKFFDSHSELAADVREVRASLKFMDLSFAVCAREVGVEGLDRTQSLAGGPLFVSTKHPHPSLPNGLGMFPVLQLDMGWVSAQTGKVFEPCLLQFWWGGVRASGYLRKIPLWDVKIEELVPLCSQLSPSADVSMYVEDWDASLNLTAMQIEKCVAIGMAHPKSLAQEIEAMQQECGDAIDEDVLCDIELIEAMEPMNKDVSGDGLERLFEFFGNFRQAQVSASNFDVDGCLLSLNWGDGWCSILYTQRSDGTDFDFYFDA